MVPCDTCGTDHITREQAKYCCPVNEPAMTDNLLHEFIRHEKQVVLFSSGIDWETTSYCEAMDARKTLEASRQRLLEAIRREILGE